jgi:hypothetical protein
MPLRRGWGIFGLGFYKDGAPTALGKSDTNFKDEIERKKMLQKFKKRRS